MMVDRLEDDQSYLKYILNTECEKTLTNSQVIKKVMITTHDYVYSQ